MKKVEKLLNSPSLESFVEGGGRWTDWRHNHTNYDEVRGSLGGEEYNTLVVEFGESLLKELSNEVLVKLVSKWVKSHVR